jgi:ABC-type bacteriocin/lantibiotic exporter with double-glycine peptidase domain
MFHFFDKKLNKEFIILTCVTFLSVFFETLGIASFLPILTSLLEPNRVEKFNFFNISEDKFIYHSLLILVCIFFFKNIFLVFSKYYQLNFAKNVQVFLTRKIVSHYIFRSYQETLLQGHSEILRNVLFEVNKVQGFVNHLAELITEFFIFFAIFLLAYYFNPKFTLVVSSIFLILFIITYFLIEKKVSSLGKQDIFLSERRINYLENILFGLIEIKVYKKENNVLKIFLNYNFKAAWVSLLTSLIKIVPKYFLEIIMICFVTFFIYSGLTSGKTINNLLLDISFYAIAVYRLFPCLNRILSSSQSLKNLAPSLKLITLELKNYEEDSSFNKNFIKYSNFKENIKIENITFSFQDKNLFFNQNLIIKKNKLILLSGLNGSGKTTLLNILLGILKPKGMKITLDNQKTFNNFEDLNLKISYVPAKTFILNDSIKNNILFFNIEEKNKIDQIINETWIKNFINKFSLKENHLISENAKNISDGEKQRISLARALYTKPEILILDEPTSNLDSETKKIFFETLVKIKESTTIILVSHENKDIINYDYNIQITQGQVKML